MRTTDLDARDSRRRRASQAELWTVWLMLLPVFAVLIYASVEDTRP